MLDRRQRFWLGISILVAGILMGAIGWISTAPVPAIPLAARPANFDAARAIQYAAILSQDFQNRVTGSEGARRASGYLRALLASMGYHVEDQLFAMWLGGRRVSGDNVIAVKPGDTAESIAVIAHYDGQRTSPQSAEDNASGAGVLLELARELGSTRHARGLILVATDAEEWGMIGARALPGFLKAHGTLAAISIDYLNAGVVPGLSMDAGGQFGGFAPLWLRTLLVDSGRARGVTVEQAAGMAEFAVRAVGVSAQDHGPLNRAGVPAVNLSTASNNSAAVRARYHTPQDVFRNFDPAAFQMMGDTLLQAVAVLDQGRPQGSRDEGALLLAGGRFLPGPAILAIQIVGFLPLWLSAALAGANLRKRKGTGLRKQLLAPVLWIMPPVLAVLLLYGLTAGGILERYELYPATPKDPFLYQIPAAVLWPLAAVLAAGFLAAWRLQARFLLSAPDFAARKGILCIWLSALVAAAMLRNPYAAWLFLAAPGYTALLLRPPGRWFWRILNLILLLAAALPFVMLVYSFGVEIFLGWRILWYLVLQTAYGVWSVWAVGIFFLAAVLWCRLLHASVFASQAFDKH